MAGSLYHSLDEGVDVRRAVALRALVFLFGRLHAYTVQPAAGAELRRARAGLQLLYNFVRS